MLKTKLMCNGLKYVEIKNNILNIKLLTWNILAPSLSNNIIEPNNETFLRRYKNIVKFIKKMQTNNYDIINFTEVDQYIGDTLNRLSLKDGLYNKEYFKYNSFFYDIYIKNFFDNYNYIYCPKPKSVDVNSISVRHGNLIMLEESIKILQIFNMQYTQDNDSNQCIIFTNILYKNEVFTVISVHLVAGNKEPRISIRSKQINYILDNIQKYAKENIILLGDFNTPDLSNEIEKSQQYKIFKPKDLNSLNYPPFKKSQANNYSKSVNAKDSKEHDHVLDYIVFNNILNERIVYSSTYTYDESDKFEVIKEQDKKKDKSDHYPISANIFFYPICKQGNNAFNNINNDSINIYITAQNIENYLNYKYLIYSTSYTKLNANLVYSNSNNLFIKNYNELQSFVKIDNNQNDHMNMTHFIYYNKNLILVTYFLENDLDIDFLNIFKTYLPNKYILMFVGNKEINVNIDKILLEVIYIDKKKIFKYTYKYNETSADFLINIE
jgi:endonuclease/exonuclease/phosphatase family metal-dependent hydrolase